MDFELSNSDLFKSLSFIHEAGQLREVLRRTFLQDAQRYENSAEHSWHLIIMAIALEKYSNTPVNLNHVIRMLVVHDLCEVYAGDTYLYDAQRDNQKETERQAMLKLLSHLPDESLYNECIALWDEFEDAKTPESLFARSLDRFHPFLEQLKNGGESWKSNNISIELALEKNAHIADGAKDLWDAYKELAAQAKLKNFFGTTTT